MTAGEDSFDGVGGPRGLVPSDLPWTPQAGFVVDQPPAQIDDAWMRTLARIQRDATPAPDQTPPGRHRKAGPAAFG